MHRERLVWLRFVALSTDGLLLGAVWAGLSWARSRLEGPGWDLPPADLSVYLPLTGLIVPVWLVALWSQGSYRYLRRKDPWTALAEIGMASLLALGMVLALLYLLQVTWVSRAVLLGFAACSVLVLALTRGLGVRVLHRLRQQEFDPTRVLLVGRPEAAAPLLSVLAAHPEWAITPVGQLGPQEAEEALARCLTEQPIDEVIVLGPPPDLAGLGRMAEVCEELGVALSMDANFLGLRTARVELQDFEGWTTLRFTSTPPQEGAWLLKRMMDVGLALLGLAACAPLLLLLGLLVRLEDGGPALFVQQRAGRYGRPFPMLKFRTMVVDAEARLAALQARNEVSGPAFKLRHDPRITRVGRWLRRSSLDELPQLYNVLRGEMSLVGPRPPLPAEVRRYARWQLRRLSVRPGLTGLWQVSGRSDVDFDRWMELDLHYIDTWSLWLDLRILLRTIPAVLRGTGAR